MDRRFAALVAVACLLTAACDGDEDQPEAAVNSTTAPTTGTAGGEPTTTAPPVAPGDLQGLVVAAATEALAATTASFDHRVAVTTGGRPVELVTTGTVDVGVPVLALESDVGSLLGTRRRPAGSKIALVLAGPRNDQTLYVRLPEPIGEEGERWLEVDVARTSLTDAREAGLDLEGLFAHVQATHPLANMALLTGIGPAVSEVGTEDVGGTPARRFQGTVNLKVARERLLELVRGSHADDMALAVERTAGAVGPSALAVEVWIAGGLPRRLAYRLDAARPGAVPGVPAGATGLARIQVQVTGYGQAVPRAVPEADETVPFEDYSG